MVASSADPVADGVAASLARPGGNITGLAYAEPDRFKKQIELLQEAAPRIRRLTVLWDFDLDVFRRSWAAPLADAGRVLGVQVLDPMRVQDATELPAAFAAMKQQADAFLVASGSLLLPECRRVADLALQHRLPGIGAFRQFPHAGLLMSYGPDLVDINRRAGRFVDRILKGTPPGELAIELPSKFDLAINLATARTLGLAIPQPLRLRATEVIQ
jgi:putative ABC transport system substrate-binding protein